MKVKIGGIWFEDKCPKGCPGKTEGLLQGGLCYRCPIFNCIPAPNDDFVLVQPKDYRDDWANEWKRWFDEGMKGRPQLRLRYETNK